MDIDVIHLVDGEDTVLSETKLSSSARRRELLGSILRSPVAKEIPAKPYVIGLTGGIASGKSHIAKFLATQGCEVGQSFAIISTSTVFRLWIATKPRTRSTRIVRKFARSSPPHSAMRLSRTEMSTERLSELLFSRIGYVTKHLHIKSR